MALKVSKIVRDNFLLKLVVSKLKSVIASFELEYFCSLLNRLPLQFYFSVRYQGSHQTSLNVQESDRSIKLLGARRWSLVPAIIQLALQSEREKAIGSIGLHNQPRNLK